MKNVIGGILIIAGIMAIAGSANDCDGKCMENANTIGEMLTVMLIGISMTIVGGFIVAK
tara:strand:+ start:172 stop:348 length:177 start_codon:yes stop_codon:yes gene_type:complete